MYKTIDNKVKGFGNGYYVMGLNHHLGYWCEIYGYSRSRYHLSRFRRVERLLFVLEVPNAVRLMTHV